MIDLTAIRFDAAGLVPAVVQEAATRDVLLLAFMNDTAVRATAATGEAHFWSRSRGALWRKGEQSGNRLLVEEIALNCEANSLLLTVRLDGAGACHDGYHSCYYRAFGADGQLHATAPRVFDPAVVYAEAALERDLRALYAGYLRLCDEDAFVAASSTARLLRAPATTQEWLLARAREELGELRGVLAGTHVHAGGDADVQLEASQVIYWLCLAAARSGLSYGDWSPHLALWRGWQGEAAVTTVGPLLALMGELGGMLRVAGMSPTVPVAADLAELRKRLA